MAIDEQSRHRLYTKLEETLGQQEATSLMELLPPVVWADVATKRDLDQLAMQLRSEMSLLGADLRAEMSVLAADLRAEMKSGFNAQTWRVATLLVALGGLVVASPHL
jgi:hypothetical protein